MPGLATQIERYSVVIAIGGVSVRLNTVDADFLELLEKLDQVEEKSKPDARQE